MIKEIFMVWVLDSFLIGKSLILVRVKIMKFWKIWWVYVVWFNFMFKDS